MVYTESKTTIDEFLTTMHEYSKMQLETVKFTNFDKFYEVYKLFIVSLDFKSLKPTFVGMGYNHFTSAKKAIEVMQYSSEFFALKIKLEEADKLENKVGR